MNLNIKDIFNKELPADLIKDNSRRQVIEACFSFVTPKHTAKPELLHVSSEMLENLGLSESDAESKDFLNVFTGNKVLEETNPYAMCYGGHQFGNWAGQLGDGRAINLFEVEHNKSNWQVQLKGAGETPYSRHADGLAVLRSSVREYLCSEAMFHLGVPTTRALSLALSGDNVLRDVMYDGNSAYEKGAIVCRTAETFLRFGSYQIFASRQDEINLKKLVDYTIKNHFTHIGEPSKEVYITFFKEVSERTLDMIIHWQRVGFVHGVMNTDNMSILGLTIDYGPYGWLEGYEYGWTPNTTDRQNKRYRYGNQPNIGLWNLIQLANAIYPLIDAAEPLEAILNQYKTDFEVKLLNMMCSKLGFLNKDENDQKLILELEDILHLTETDMTIFFRNLSNFEKEKPSEGLHVISDAFYKPDEVTGNIEKRWKSWFEEYAKRLRQESFSNDERKDKMNTINPKYVLRNYMAQLAIDDADNGDYKLIDELFNMLRKPYDEQPEYRKWFAKRPEWARHKVGCSMLSCSS
ncbi:YdiU family protein [uncultured Algibacter sp.]|uniref:protein adenylyltransferase SelO n=1 Tax=uncultured Algibacter sp. TaxID=298659 RepID=UPI002623DEA7|nr:YdiU family protein [uncultured Algibacter sp.]